MADSGAQNQSSFPYHLTERREELTETLRSRLIECGWRDQVANMCRNLIQKHGVEKIRLEEIIEEVGPKARQDIPEHLRSEMIELMKNIGKR